MPRLSVILPARNAEATIGRAVASTLRAMPNDAQLLVLDDGSTDTTAVEALRAGETKHGLDPRLKVESRPASGGIARALTWLLANIDSEFVARMDADDISAPWRFQRAMSALNRGTDVVFQQVAFLQGTKLKPQPPVSIPPEVFSLYLLLTNPVSHPTMVARRAALDSVGGYREVPAEDYDLWLRLAAAGFAQRRLPLWGLAYRVHPDQITASSEWRGKSWTNPDQAEAYSKLAQRRVGAPLERIVALALKPSGERGVALDHAEALLAQAISRVPHPHRLLLQRKLKERISWARTYEQPQSLKDRHEG